MDYKSPLLYVSDAVTAMHAVMPTDKKELANHLVFLDSKRLLIAEKRGEWLQLLCEKKNQMLHPKDSQLTEMDRKIMLNASIAVIERDYEFLLSLEHLMQERIALGKLLLT